MILALLLAAQPQVVAVLEFRDKVPAEQRIDAAFLSDQVRAAVKENLPQSKVITRENMLVLLQASGKKLEECEGECEVETGRRIGADLVVSGELLRFGTQYKLNMKLHDTRSGELISGAVASGATADDLDRALRPAVEKLLAPLRPEAHQDRLSDQREAARRETPPVAPPEPRRERSEYKGTVLQVWGVLGYAQASAESSAVGVATVQSKGFSYGLGGSFFFHLAGPLYLGGLADYSFFPGASGASGSGLFFGGGLRIAVGAGAVTVAGGYTDVRGDADANGPGILGAVDYPLSSSFFLRLQGSWRHDVEQTTGGALTVDIVHVVYCGQAGLALVF